MERTEIYNTEVVIYCIIDGDVKKRKFAYFSNDGSDLTVVSNLDEEFVFQRDAFLTLAEANEEMRTRLRDC